MSNYHRNYSRDLLVSLHGTKYLYGEKGHSVQFVVSRVPAAKERPHGLKYSLTLHNEYLKRIAGHDNAHQVKTGKGPGGKRVEYDHKHRYNVIKHYKYIDEITLLEDYWSLVENVLAAEGVKL